MSKGALPMMNTRCTKLSMVRDDAKLSKTSNKKCPVVLHGDHSEFATATPQLRHSYANATPMLRQCYANATPMIRHALLDRQLWGLLAAYGEHWALMGDWWVGKEFVIKPRFARICSRWKGQERNCAYFSCPAILLFLFLTFYRWSYELGQELLFI